MKDLRIVPGAFVVWAVGILFITASHIGQTPRPTSSVVFEAVVLFVCFVSGYFTRVSQEKPQ